MIDYMVGVDAIAIHTCPVKMGTGNHSYKIITAPDVSLLSVMTVSALGTLISDYARDV